MDRDYGGLCGLDGEWKAGEELGFLAGRIWMSRGVIILRTPGSR